MGATFVVIGVLCVMFLSELPQTMGYLRDNFKCRVVQNTTLVYNDDAFGRRCWDVINIPTCMGYCRSSVRGDNNFPGRHRMNTVCVHGQRRTVEIHLKNCPEGVEPSLKKYEYIEAITCSCSTCDSATTSCESAHKRGRPSAPETPAQPVDRIDVILKPVQTRPREQKWPGPIPELLPPSWFP